MIPKNFLTSSYILYPFVTIMLVAILMISLAPAVVQAATPAAPAAAARGAGGVAASTIRGQAAGVLGSVTGNVLLIYGALYVLQTVASGLLTLSGWILDQMFILNTEATPSSLTVIEIGWKIARDIANGFFILVILWIALTIIFNLETLGGKKLLIRVVIIALLINFSLVMVSAVFGFANVLARPFRAAITGPGNKGVSEIIVANTRIYNVVNTVNADAIEKLKASKEAEDAAEAARKPSPSTLKQLNLLGAKEANADGVDDTLTGVATLCSIGLLFGPTALPAGICAGSAIAVAYAKSFFTGTDGGIGGIIETGLNSAVSLALGSIFLIITSFAFLATAVVLIGRVVAMVFLSILAPIAFLLHTMPGKFAGKYWDMWLESLLKWAFFAPAFYFLFYISLVVLQQMSSGQKDVTTFTGSLQQMFNLIVFLIFLFASIGLAKKMGITVADSFIKWGQKAGWGALGLAGGLAMGTFKRTALPLIGRGAAAADKRLGNIETPWLRRSLALPATGLRALTGVGRKQVLDRQKSFAGQTTDELQRALGQRAYMTQADATAMMLELAKRRAVAPKEGIQGYGTDQMRAAVDQIREAGGNYMEILKANPSIARASDFTDADLKKAIDIGKDRLGLNFANNQDLAAQMHVWSKMDGGDMKNLDTKVFDASEIALTTPDGATFTRGDLAKEMFIGTGRGEQFSGLGRASTSATEKVNNYFSTTRGKQLITQMAPGAYEYTQTNIARGLGWNLPEDHQKPLETLKGELAGLNDTLKTLRGRIAQLRALSGNQGDKEAKKIEEKNIPLANARIQEVLEAMNEAKKGLVEELKRKGAAQEPLPPPTP